MALIIIRVILLAFAAWGAYISYMILAEWGYAPVPARAARVVGRGSFLARPQPYALYCARVPRHPGLTRYEMLIQEARLIPDAAARAQVLAQIKRYEHVPSAATVAKARALKGSPLLSFEQWVALQNND